MPPCKAEENFNSTEELAGDIAEYIAGGMDREDIAKELKISLSVINQIIELCIVPAIEAALDEGTLKVQRNDKSDGLIAEKLEHIFSPDTSYEKYESFAERLRCISRVLEPKIKTNEQGIIKLCFENRSRQAEKEGLPLKLRKYDPFAELGSTYITIAGLRLIKYDMQLSESTVDQLRKTEKCLCRGNNEKYKYLLEEHNPALTYLRNFKTDNNCGLTHISVILNEDPNRSYASLVAEYSVDRNIPFVVGLMMIEDLKKIEGGIYYTDKSDKKSEGTRQKWEGTEPCRLPPINYHKMSRSGQSSLPGLKDRFTIKTYMDCGENVERTAKLLKVPKNIVYERLRESGFTEIEKIPVEIEEWLNSETTEAVTDALITKDQLPESSILPVKKPSSGPEDLELAVAYYANNKDERAAAEQLGIPQSLFEILIRPVKKAKGTSLLDVAAVDIVCNGDTEKAVAILNINREWYEKKRAQAHRQYRNGDNLFISRLSQNDTLQK